MNLEDLQQAWDDQELEITQQYDLFSSPDAAVLATRFRRKQKLFEHQLFRRDYLEVAIAIPMALLFSRAGWKSSSWGMYLLSAGCVLVGVFLFMERIRSRKKKNRSFDSVLENMKAMLDEVEHQIYLVKNVFWWYLFPFVIGFIGLAVESLLDGHGHVHQAIIIANLSIELIVCYLIFILNQRAIRVDLAPRRDELVELLASLENSE